MMGGGMPSKMDMDSLYSEEDSQAPDQQDQDQESGEVVVPKDSLPAGVKPGDTLTFEVSADLKDEISLRLVSDNGGNKDSSAQEIEALDQGES